MNESPLPEALEDFLQHPPCVPVDVNRREELARRTSALLPRPAWRRWPVTAAIAASIGIAIVSAYIGYRIGNQQARQVIVERPNDPAPKKTQPEPKPAVAVVSADPRALEWSAFDAADDQERVRLYFQAGDLYFEKLRDHESALRCYHQAIHYSSARELEITPNDNWLVMALKRDHRKEN